VVSLNRPWGGQNPPAKGGHFERLFHMELDSNIEVDEDLKLILEGRSGNTVLSIEEFDPKPMYLKLYLTKSMERSDSPTLLLILSETGNDSEDTGLFLIHNFGKFKECHEIFDTIRVSGQRSIIAEEPSKLMFREFVMDCSRQFNSILELMQGIFNCFEYNLTAEDRKQAELQSFSENSIN
jgi:hypothetical protein